MKNYYLVMDRYKPSIRNIEITKSLIDKILNTISLTLRKIFVSARTLSKLAGQLISTKYVVGDIVQLKTRFLYKSIEQSSSWDKTFNIGNYNDTVDEILFWKFSLVKYKNKVINCYYIPLFHVHSDTSNTVIASVFDVRGKKNICYRNLTDLEKTFSSTWLELEASDFLYSLRLNSSKINVFIGIQTISQLNKQ